MTHFDDVLFGIAGSLVVLARWTVPSDPAESVAHRIGHTIAPSAAEVRPIPRRVAALAELHRGAAIRPTPNRLDSVTTTAAPVHRVTTSPRLWAGGRFL
ncbi:MAG: hypothetical protein MUF54_11860 [Polyangiaceae bacterium]|nr:hypothetical protein [Polyangiaceae bacterium]